MNPPARAQNFDARARIDLKWLEARRGRVRGYQNRRQERKGRDGKQLWSEISRLWTQSELQCFQLWRHLAKLATFKSSATTDIFGKWRLFGNFLGILEIRLTNNLYETIWQHLATSKKWCDKRARQTKMTILRGKLGDTGAQLSGNTVHFTQDRIDRAKKIAGFHMSSRKCCPSPFRSTHRDKYRKKW